MNILLKYPGTVSYLLLIFLVNLLFPYFPLYKFFGPPFSAGDLTIGIIYVARDFSQREIGKNVLFSQLYVCGQANSDRQHRRFSGWRVN
jgi:hypothetical protein